MPTLALPNGGFGKYNFDLGSSPEFSLDATNPIDKIYKEFYLPGIRDLINSKRILTTYASTRMTDVSGKYALIPLRVGRNESSMFIGENGYLPEPGNQAYDNAQYRVHYNYARILFTGPAAASSRDTRGAWVAIHDAEIAGVAQDKQHENNRVMFGDGSGVMATTLANGGPATTFQVENPGGFANDGPGAQYLRPDMLIAILDSATLVPVTIGTSEAGYIISVDQSTGTIQVSETKGGTAASITVGAGDLVVKAARQTGLRVLLDTSYLNEAFGLAALVDEGNPFGRNVGEIDATTQALWNAPVIDNGGTALPFDQDMLQRGMDKLDTQSDGSVQLWLTSHGVRRAYMTTLVANKRFVGTMELDGGFRAVLYDDIPLVVDKDCTRGRVYGLDFDTLFQITETDYHWLDQDGSVLSRLPDRDAVQATLARYWNFVTDARNRNVVIKDIEDN